MALAFRDQSTQKDVPLKTAIDSNGEHSLVAKLFAAPAADWQFACPSVLNNVTPVVIKAAGAAGIKTYLTNLYIKNTNAVATEVQILDGATVIWRGHVSANMVQADPIEFLTPLRGTAATDMKIVAVTTGASIYYNAQGYQAA